MKVLLTGGSGFLGSSLCRDLAEAGHDVVVLDDNSRGRADRLLEMGSNVRLVEGDIRDADTVLRATEGVEVVYHLAYINGTRYFYERPADVLEVGIKGTLNTIEAALAHGVRRYVLASTSETYNEPETVPTPESEPLKIPDVLNPRFSYGGGKIACELMALHMGAPRGLETVVFRPHNFYGPDMGNEHVIPEISRRVVEVSEGLTKTAIDLPIQGDGSETRSFCFVTDGSAGAHLVGERGAPGEIYHLGTERELSIADLVRLIGSSLGVEVTPVPGPLRAGGTTRRCPDITKARALGFEPRVELEEGVARTARWYADTVLGATAGAR
ncbi:NAD-dependent epimerase/dehydratase family protein [Angustibacter speluncae]